MSENIIDITESVFTLGFWHDSDQNKIEFNLAKIGSY